MATKTSKQILTLIDILELKIKSGAVPAEYLEGLQGQLNEISPPNNDPRYHQYAFELQALIYRSQGKPEESAKCIGAAVEQAGAPEKLHARLLKSDIRRDPSIVGENTAPEDSKGPGKLSLLTEAEQNFLRRYDLERTPEVDFLTRSLPLFAVMFILSGGMYGTYWFYKNWQAIRDAANSNYSPLWRTILSLFYIWPLFKIMILMAKSRGFKPSYSGGALATGYILTAFVGAMFALSFEKSWVQALSTQLITSCLYVFILAIAQQAASYATSKQSNVSEVRPINYVELLFVVAGLLFLIASFSNYHQAILPKTNSSVSNHNTKTKS